MESSAPRSPAGPLATGDAGGNGTLPRRWRHLSGFFFGYEDFTDPTKVTRVTRHAVSHGVASDELLDAKAAAIGILVVQQLAYLLPGEQQCGP